MAIDFIPRGDLASPKNVHATSVATWPKDQLGKKVPVENNGGGTQFTHGKTKTK